MTNMEITFDEASEALDELLVGDFTLAEAADAEALVDALSGNDDKLVQDIKARHNDESLKYRSSELPEAHTELGIDAHIGEPTDFANLVTVHDDWNMSAADKRASADNELREDMAYMASAGVDWWGSISLSGFGPTAIVDGHGSGISLLNPSHVITTVPPVDADELRDDAGMRPAGSFESGYRVAGMYRDFLQAASVSTPELDDLFTSEGYSWDNLSEAEMDDKALRIEAWWN